MANNKLNKFKALVSDEKSGWLEKAKYRKENQDWLNISFAISVKIMSVLRANKKSGTFPKNQKELAQALECTPQYVNKLLKGAEKLNIETISKIQNALDISIISLGSKFKGIEIVAKNEVVISKPKNTVNSKFKRTGKLINYNFMASKNSPQTSEYRVG